MTPISFINALSCVSCGETFDPDEIDYTCPACGPIKGTLDILYDWSKLAEVFTPEILRQRRGTTIWRYHELLPIRNVVAQVQIPVGMTPLFRLECDMGFPLPSIVLVKDDTRHPSGSTKDRASAVGIARAREKSAPAIAAASTGNAASSIAMFAARAGLPCYIFVPKTAPPAKLAQIQAHGAKLVMVSGSYDDAFEICHHICEKWDIYNRNTATNPFLGEGKKTAALEIWEQLGYNVPDTVVVPVGDGCIIGGIAKGFSDLFNLGLIPKVPRLIGIQADGSSAIAEAWFMGENVCAPSAATTIADSIAVSVPRDQTKALRAVNETDGCFITVTDKEILAAMNSLATIAGILVEPAAAAPMAGLRKAMEIGKIAAHEETVILHTGHGLKDISAMQKASIWNRPTPIDSNVNAAEEALGLGKIT
jgi:threonine synthase